MTHLVIKIIPMGACNNNKETIQESLTSLIPSLASPDLEQLAAVVALLSSMKGRQTVRIF